MTKRIYSKLASKEYMNNFESIFGKEKEIEEDGTEAERAKRLEDFGDGLFEKKSQTNDEVVEILKNSDKSHITPSNKAEYKPEPKPKSLLDRLWNILGI